MKTLLSAKNLIKVYGEEPSLTYALNGVSANIKSGEFVAIIGPSGSGKSTLMHILGCLDKPDKGEYFFEDKEISKCTDSELAKIRNAKIGFVFQSFNLLPRTSSLKNVALPLVYAGIAPNERERRAIELLNELGLGEKLQSTPAKMSGGQQQRVAIARALINDPVVIFADEPTGNLDSKASQEIIKIFQTLNKKGHTIVMITHEMEIANHAKRIITIRDGKITSDKTRNSKHVFRRKRDSIRNKS